MNSSSESWFCLTPPNSWLTGRTWVSEASWLLKLAHYLCVHIIDGLMKPIFDSHCSCEVDRGIIYAYTLNLSQFDHGFICKKQPEYLAVQ